MVICLERGACDLPMVQLMLLPPHRLLLGLTYEDAKKLPKNRHLGTIAQLRRAISSQLARIDNRKKNLLSSNTASTCLYNMVNFGPLLAEIVSLVWGTPGNFNGFRVLTALLHGTVVVGVSQTLRR